MSVVRSLAGAPPVQLVPVAQAVVPEGIQVVLKTWIRRFFKGILTGAGQN